ncbi:Transmembrane domain-containing protein [Spironucleus salmonicida]|uniref:Transmembrane domain-containing protein n=1 Tax=Spironucleus salmonicida TaxID=348837 RepID=V6LLM6_9EUKA|nr:Transmembrane domain-containing protein [Spironucleus salmonicida]KAH0576228.1 Transmembrane domain-containing protein [Spironucleus salmonicida]|eukprot:EST45462.1 Transmembrane domain-containing protein [Spironucleus salmonicida]
MAATGKKPAISLVVWIYIVSGLVCSTGCGLVAKAMFLETLPTCPTCAAVPFNHPYMQTLFMFIGEFCCIFIWLTSEFVRKHRALPQTPLKEGKTFYRFIPHTFLFAIPTIFDLVSSTMFNIGNYYSDPSVYAILTNMTVVFVALVSLCIFRDYRQRFDLPQLMGLVILFLGATIIALGSILFTQQNSVALNPAMGIIFTLLGCFIASWFYLAEELSLRRIQTIGFMGVANEGGWGLIFCAIALPILNIVTDPLSTTIPKSNFEDLAGWAYQMSISYKQVLYHIFYALFVLVLNFTGMEITNHVSAATRTTFGSLKPILVWIMSISLGWEPWNPQSTPVKWAGFVVVTCGVLIFNNVLLVIPFLKRPNQVLHGKWMGRHKPEDQAAPDADCPAEDFKQTVDRAAEDEIITAVETRAEPLERVH